MPFNSSLLKKKLSTIILAGGIGKRMYSKTPKVLHKILGKPIISFAVELAHKIKSDEVIVVVGKDAKELKRSIGKEVKYAIQPTPLGSGDAAKKGIAIASNKNTLILNGDVPLLTEATIIQLLNNHKRQDADMTILTCKVKDPHGYGRIIRGKKNTISSIVEQSDATIRQQKIKEINAGVYYGNKELLSSSLNRITSDNRQGEYYLTDIVKEMLRKEKKVVGFTIYNEEEITGINSKWELSKVREIVKMKWFTQLMYNGVYIEDPSTTNIDLSAQIGNYVHIRPYTIIEGNTEIEDGMTIGPFVWIKNGKKMKNSVRSKI